MALVLSLGALAACTSGGGSTHQSPAAQNGSSTSGGGSAVSGSSTGAAPSSTAVAGPAVITALPALGAKTLDPAEPIKVSIANGRFTSVLLTNPFGKHVKGAVSSDGSTWQSSEALGYSRTYKLVATGTDASGHQIVKQGSYTTVTPDNKTQPYINTIYGAPIGTGATYGVGMIVTVNFDEQIPDKKAAMAAMKVTTTPHVDGAWYWLSDSIAHWRPSSYYAPGTKVSVNIDVYGKNLGHGLYGQSDQSASFTIGARHISIANAKTHQVQVYFDGVLKRTMPTSMGRGGYVQGKWGPISLWTPNGVFTVIGHENPAHMSSASYGLPTNSPDGYKTLIVPWATKISTDGIYLHQLDETVWAQGHQNLSHGCLNLNQTNAQWFYQNARVGDVVQVVKSGGQDVTLEQGGDWSVPWSQWSKGNL